ncbi:hypothetical protein GQ55_1G024800 [Panicum hallii var. hallii]|uniref:4Fe-4S ferredoxin-type domain-containing protein n=2 Tax=Panicum hallii TaxID=206008 RepID=A0A2T7F1H7_9POAL|nr:uncharacterized protein LOC112879107 [Panicum hallii]PAN03848.1 hypothetical protein PAHAL_1G024700 [Panicum hallii]PUZ73926.1 hypothetical protein GQ55_1G024800 [Panicum hallii var. hallii]
MKGSNGGGSLLSVTLIWLAILFGCLALSAQCRSHELLKNVGRTRGVYLTGSASNRSAYHTQIECPPAADDDGESKLKLIFCTVKCFCNGVHGDAICYCCQKPPGPVCYEQLADCQANCPTCNPDCPPGAAAEGQRLLATTNATSYL